METCRHALASSDFHPHGSPVLIRLGTNAVFRVDTAPGPILVRVSPSDYDPELIDQQLQLASWLKYQGFPTSQPLRPDIAWSDGRPVTFWEFITSDTSTAGVMRMLGSTAAIFHQLTDAYIGELPMWEPLGRLGPRLDVVPCDQSFSEADRILLKSWRDRLTSAVEKLEFQRATGPIHGDIHTGNAIVSDGRLYLIDLDRIARGPREWDLSQPLVASQMFGVSQRDIDDFMVGYGWDMRTYDGADVLVRLRALFMTSWLLTLPRTSRVREEITNRLAFWRDPDGKPPRWHPV